MKKEPEPFLWLNPTEMLQISRKLGLHLHGCFVTLMMETAESNGIIDVDNAVDLLTAAPEMNEDKARQALSDLISKGVMTREGGTLTITAFGTTIVPDYDDWQPK